MVYVPNMVCVYTASLEVHDLWRGSPHEEPPLQADPGAQHSLHRPAPPAAHWHASTEQATRAVGAAQLPATLHLQVLLHIRAVVQRTLRHNWWKGTSIHTGFSVADQFVMVSSFFRILWCPCHFLYFLRHRICKTMTMRRRHICLILKMSWRNPFLLF